MMEEKDSLRSMAERIARRVSQGQGVDAAARAERGGNLSGELAAVRASLSEIEKRLSYIEAHFAHDDSVTPPDTNSEYTSLSNNRAESLAAGPTSVRSPWLSGVYFPATHPSQERFAVDEAALSELVDFFEKEKTCGLEPGGKPCDHCAACSSRGF